MNKEEIDKEKTEWPVVVIGRQFGSGGRRIGRLVAEKLGYAYYDSELLSQAASRLGISKDVFERHEERRPSILRSMLQGAFGIPDNFHDVSISSERLYKEQSRLIREIASEGPCVIVGRTADHILRDFPNKVSVFLHAPLQYRAVQIVVRGEANDTAEAIELAKKHDKCREDYYNYFTGSDAWGLSSNYDLSLDSSAIDIASAADLIVAFCEGKFNKSREMK